MLRDGAVVRSAIRGRERWDVGPLRSHPRYAAALERELSRHEPIRQVFANPLTGRLLLRYDPGVQRTEIHDRLHSALDIAPASNDELREWRTEWPRGFHRSPDDAAVEQARTRLILSGTLLAGVLAKRALFGVGMFAGSPAFVTASAVMTIISGYTLLNRGLNAMTETVGISGRTLLTFATLGLNVAAESFDGLGAIVFAHAGELAEATAIRRMRGEIRVLGPAWDVPHPATSMHTAALLAAGGAYLLTGDPQRSLAMLLGGLPLATRESTITARAIAMHRAIREDDDQELLRRMLLVIRDNQRAARFIGAAGFTAAAFGKMSHGTAARLHNYTRLALELNSLRLLLPLPSHRADGGTAAAEFVRS